MIKAGIIGATGYAGAELVRLLLGHKDAEIVWYGSRSYVDQPYASIYQNMFQLVDAKCMDDNMDELAKEADVIFTATPQGLCASLINEDILSHAKVIDLSADFRLKDVKVYEEWYKMEHKAPQYIEEAVYGLCEINREKIRGARIVANPGCYPTCSTLSIYPLVKEQLIDPDTIIIDAKSGTSGAGRGAKTDNLFCEVNENMKAYGVDCLFTAIMFSMVGYFNGCGKTTFVMIQGIIGAFCVRIPVSYLMSKIEPVSLFKVGLATPTSTLVQIILCISFFIFLSKKTPKEDMNVDNLQEMQAL